MAMTKKQIASLITKLGFSKNDGVANVYSKNYKKNSNYQVRINFDTERINYETGSQNDSIKVLGNFSTNFDKDENFVVLECVDRLLECGYKPNSIEIEKTWPSGHGTSGRLDVLVRKLNGDPYIMIECKTWGTEYEKEKSNMLETQKIGNEEVPKGQLFLYYWEEKKTEYLCLYASRLNGDDVEYVNSIVQVKDEWQTLSNKKEVFNYWNKTFRNAGIFESGIMPYNIEVKALRRKDLEKINSESSNRIFYQFAEILRHNSISDKSNAFNKLLNLFICKIIDEDRNEDDEVLFQWKENTTYVSMQSALEDLYKQGMKKYLNTEVTDYSEHDVDYILNQLDDDNREKMKKIIQDLRLQKNPEFAFKEVYNSESFEDNAKVLKEAVELLQVYQFRYGHKQQFLGNFFELLLNSSIKQESGQFFTPVPIARFMVSSLPLHEIIDKNIAEDRNLLLPIMADYACGAGHFLTEYMDVLQDIINNFDVSHAKLSVRNAISKWKQIEGSNYPQGEFEWAKDFVYGIEKDYMLVKTTKISTFLNGDGDANIIHADGLDNFYSDKYVGSLKSTNNVNHNFDVIIANPPYSVNSFKQTLPCETDLFEVYPDLTESSSEIECLFIQRTNDLLREGGVASLVLPTSILNNNGTIHEKTRKILIENFSIKSIIQMGKNTFMETGTSTMIVFLQKRKSDELTKAETYAKSFFRNHQDFTYKGIQEVMHEYVEQSFDDVSFDDYVSMTKGVYSDSIKTTDYYIENEENFKNSKDYKALIKTKKYKNLSSSDQTKAVNDLFKEFLNGIELLHVKYYLLMLGEKTILANTGDKDDEKRFIGYEFSKRRGYEGIHLFKDEDDHIASSLYDETGQHFNNEKLDYYIYKNYKNEEIVIPDCLSSNAKVYDSFKILEFYNLTCSCKITLIPDLKVIIKPDFDEHFRMGDYNLIDLSKGTTITEREVKPGNIPVVAGGKTEAYYHNVYNRDANIITISASGSAGFVNYWDRPIFASDCYTVLSKNENIICTKFIYYCLKLKQDEIYLLQRGQSPVHVYPEQLNKIKFPKYEIQKQVEIGNNYFNYLNQIDTLNSQITTLLNEEETLISSVDKNKCVATVLGDENYVGLKRGPFGGMLKKEIFVPKGFKVYEQKNAIQNDISLGRYYITEQKFNEMNGFEVLPNDILMSCSGTIGKFIVIPEGSPKGIINQALLRIRGTEKVNPVYLKLILTDLTNTFIKNSHGTGIENVNSIDVLKTFKIYIPEMPDQEKVVEKYNDIEKKITDLKAKIDSINKQIESLID